MVRYPHNAVITWRTSTKDDTTGNYTDGPEQTLTLNGRLQTSTPGTQVLDGERRVNVDYKFFTSIVNVPIGAIMAVNGMTRKVLYVFSYQTYCEI